MSATAEQMRIERRPDRGRVREMVDIAEMDRVEMAERIGSLEAELAAKDRALADTKRTLVVAENKIRSTGAGDLTPDQREWLLSLADDRDAAEEWLNALIDEGVTIAVPAEDCDHCGGTFTVDQLAGCLCPTCRQREVAADHAFDFERE